MLPLLLCVWMWVVAVVNGQYGCPGCASTQQGYQGGVQNRAYPGQPCTQNTICAGGTYCSPGGTCLCLPGYSRTLTDCIPQVSGSAGGSYQQYGQQYQTGYQQYGYQQQYPNYGGYQQQQYGYQQQYPSYGGYQQQQYGYGYQQSGYQQPCSYQGGGCNTGYQQVYRPQVPQQVVYPQQQQVIYPQQQQQIIYPQQQQVYPQQTGCQYQGAGGCSTGYTGYQPQQPQIIVQQGTIPVGGACQVQPQQGGCTMGAACQGSTCQCTSNYYQQGSTCMGKKALRRKRFVDMRLFLNRFMM